MRPIAYGIAKELLRFVPTADPEDIAADAMCGAMKAARRYDPATGVPFGAYARHRMRGEAMDGLRRMDYLERTTRRRVGEDIAEAEQQGRTYEDRRMAWPLSLDVAFALDDGGISLSDVLVDSGKGPEEQFIDRELLRQAFSVLTGQYREVIERVYWFDHVMSDIAIEWGVSPSRLSQIHSVAIRRMRTALLDRGIDTKFLVDTLRRERGKAGAGRIDPADRLRLAVADVWGA